jgi:protein TonB
MSSAMSAAGASPMPALPELPELGAPSRLSAAFWLALAAEIALALALVWAMERGPASHSLPRPVEQVRLVQMPKPVEKPKLPVEHPRPAPLRNVFHPRPVPLPPPPPVALPPPLPLPPSPIAAAAPKPPPPPPRARPAVDPEQKSTYLGQVRAAIQGAVQFPSQARMLRMDGKVRVKFDLIDGVISNVQIVTPGRIESFNANALLAVHDATIPAPPQALMHHVFTLVLWVKFHLHHSL